MNSRNVFGASCKAESGRVSFHGIFTPLKSQLNDQNSVSSHLPVDRASTVQQLNRIQRNLNNLAKDLDVSENSSKSSKRKYKEDNSQRY